MKKLLWFALLLPVAAYIPVVALWGDSVQANIAIFAGLLVAGMSTGLALLLKARLQRQRKRVFLALVSVLYAVILMGLIDIILLAAGARPLFIQGSSEGFGDLATLMFWVVIIIPVAYFLSSALLVATYVSHRRRGRTA